MEATNTELWNDTIEKVVYLARHGSSEDNEAPVFQRLDTPLSTAGLVQARHLAQRIAKIPFTKLISSTLPRALQTAGVISNETGIEVEPSALFVERVKPSRIAGIALDDPDASRLWHEWEDSLFTAGKRVEDGENFDDVMKRADRALAFLRDVEDSATAVVSHGFFMRTIVARVMLGDSLTGRAFRHFQTHAEMENTGITVLRYGMHRGENTWSLWIYNDHAHLG